MLRWKSVPLLLVLALSAASLSGGASFSDSPLPDLVVEITGPSLGKAGDEIGDQVTVEVNNLGSAIAPGRTPDGGRNLDGYTVEIVLSSDDDVPVQHSPYYSAFRDGAQLHGGLIWWTPDVYPNFELPLWPSNRSHERDLQIPPDTPSGDYFVCAVVDPLGTVDEEDEDNNVACAPISIQGVEPSLPPTSDETPTPNPEPTTAPHPKPGAEYSTHPKPGAEYSTHPKPGAEYSTHPKPGAKYSAHSDTHPDP